MTPFAPEPKQSASLKDSVVVLTGGATGIGAATVQRLHSLGANVIFGDVNKTAGNALAKSLNGADSAGKEAVHFLPCDVTVYADNLALFKHAYSTFGRVDHAIAIAGIAPREGWFEMPPDASDEVLLQEVEKEPGAAVLDVNLHGALKFTRIAAVYLRLGRSSTAIAEATTPAALGNKSITLIASSAGIMGYPGIPLYTMSKHALMGLMRSLRGSLYPGLGIRVNTVNPWVTNTGMTAPFYAYWVKAGMPMNEPEDIARVICDVLGAYAPSISRKPAVVDAVNGQAFYVEGGRAWEIEAGLKETEAAWLGKQQSEDHAKQSEFFNSMRIGGEREW